MSSDKCYKNGQQEIGVSRINCFINITQMIQKKSQFVIQLNSHDNFLEEDWSIINQKCNTDIKQRAFLQQLSNTAISDNN